MKSPCCDAVVNTIPCKECLGWPLSWDNCCEECKECDGTGSSPNEFECSACGNLLEPCSLIQE